MSTDPTNEEVSRRLSSMLNADEAVLLAALDRVRAEFEHRGLKGDALERSLRELLSRRLPRRFRVGTGEVIDRFGARSSQLDVILLTDEQPFVHADDESGMYLIEGVAAAGEVKTRLDGAALDDILQKGGRIRGLRPTYLQGDEIYTNPSDRSRFVESIPYFALAMESSLSAETTLERLGADSGAQNGSGERLARLDALVVIGQGVYFNFHDGKGASQFVTTDGVSVTGWMGPFRGNALVQLFVWLNGVMPRVNRRQSVLPVYLENIHESDDDGIPASDGDPSVTNAQYP
jgi:hypothetical protein